MLAVEGLSKSYGPQFCSKKSVSALTGRKGGGGWQKWSREINSFPVIAGLEEPDEGRIVIPKNYRIGYLSRP